MDFAHVVLGQIAGICPRVSEHFVALIKRLSEAESIFRGEGSLTLERGEIVKLRRDLFGRFFLFAYLAFFADAAFANGKSFFLIPETLRSPVWIPEFFFQSRSIHLPG